MLHDNEETLTREARLAAAHISLRTGKKAVALLYLDVVDASGKVVKANDRG